MSKCRLQKRETGVLYLTPSLVARNHHRAQTCLGSVKHGHGNLKKVGIRSSESCSPTACNSNGWRVMTSRRDIETPGWISYSHRDNATKQNWLESVVSRRRTPYSRREACDAEIDHSIRYGGQKIPRKAIEAISTLSPPYELVSWCIRMVELVVV